MTMKDENYIKGFEIGADLKSQAELDKLLDEQRDFVTGVKEGFDTAKGVVEKVEGMGI
jgi:hypothetical protein